MCRGKLYTPLGMTSTSSRQADFLKHDNRAALHVMIDCKWTALVKRNPDPQAPAGGVSSNVRDLAQWMRIELANGKFDGKQLINEEALALSHVPLIDCGVNPVGGGSSSMARLEPGLHPLWLAMGSCRRLQPRCTKRRVPLA
jgi:CubicO group peptidase (beta-lactamase class C family)